METPEERHLRLAQEKLDQFDVKAHPAVKLKNFKETGRGLSVQKEVAKGTCLICVPENRF